MCKIRIARLELRTGFPNNDALVVLLATGVIWCLLNYIILGGWRTTTIIRKANIYYIDKPMGRIIVRGWWGRAVRSLPNAFHFPTLFRAMQERHCEEKSQMDLNRTKVHGWL